MLLLHFWFFDRTSVPYPIRLLPYHFMCVCKACIYYLSVYSKHFWISLKTKSNFDLKLTEDAKLEILAKEREVEMAQEQAELDVKHIAQQMKHLQYENQNRIGEIRAEFETQLKLAQEDHGLQELELLNDKRELRRLLREKDEMTELQIQQLKMKQSEELR